MFYSLTTFEGDRYMQSVQDLASRYKFAPMVSESIASGEATAAHLDRLFKIHGAPLVLKRDNGPNLNSSAVNAVLAEYGVIPLNSPCYYPQYNGAIEVAQGEIKDAMRSSGLDEVDVELCAKLAVQELNHKPRRVLKHKHACQVFSQNKQRWTKRQRKEVYDWIIQAASVRVAKMGDDSPAAIATAYRLTVQIYLTAHGYLRVKKGKHVLPSLELQNDRN